MSTNLLNQENIIKKVYDPSTESLKTSITQTIPPGTVVVSIDDTTDSIKIGDGHGHYLAVNPDGSLNVVATVGSPGVIGSNYYEITSVPNNTPTIIGTFTVGSTNTQLLRVDVSGTNIAEYVLLISSTIQDKKRTYFGSALNTTFDFSGLGVSVGATVQIQVTHFRPSTGDFNCRIETKVG